MNAKNINSDSQAVTKFVQEKVPSLDEYLLDELEMRVLNDICQFLEAFHEVQQIVSAEKTPTLAIVLPLYKDLIEMLKDLKIHLPNLAHAIAASVDKLREYMDKARGTRLYTLAMGKHISTSFPFQTRI